MTLVELLIVLLLLATLALLAVPATGRQDDGRVRQAAQLLLADLEQAQVHAISNTDDPCIVVFHEDGRGYHLATTSEPQTPLPIGGGGDKPYKTRFGEGRAATLEGVTFGALDVGEDDKLHYDELGRPRCSGLDATVVLERHDTAVQVVIDAGTGHARMLLPE